MHRTVAILFAVLVGTLASAERKWITPPEYPLYLLPYASVQKDLQLSPAVVQKIAKVEADARQRQLKMLSSIEAGKQVAPIPRDEAVAEMRTHDATLVALLSASQRARLKEIGLQAEGINGLVKPSMTKVLLLTPDQVTRLLQASRMRQMELRKLRADLIGNGHLSGKNPKESANRLAAAQAKSIRIMDSDAEKILTAKQVKRWKGMMGRVFPIETLFLPQPLLSVKVRPGSHH